jgi:hypothetical protein
MREIIVILPNRPGALAEMAELLGQANLNIINLNVEAADEHGAVAVSVDHYAEALAVLRAAGFQAVSEEALVVSVRDEPGALARLAKRLGDARINMRSLRILCREDDSALVAIVSDKQDEARRLLADVLVSNLPGRGS